MWQENGYELAPKTRQLLLVDLPTARTATDTSKPPYELEAGVWNSRFFAELLRHPLPARHHDYVSVLRKAGRKQVGSASRPLDTSSPTERAREGATLGDPGKGGRGRVRAVRQSAGVKGRDRRQVGRGIFCSPTARSPSGHPAGRFCVMDASCFARGALVLCMNKEN